MRSYAKAGDIGLDTEMIVVRRDSKRSPRVTSHSGEENTRCTISLSRWIHFNNARAIIAPEMVLYE